MRVKAMLAAVYSFVDCSFAGWEAGWRLTLPQINMEVHTGLHMEDSSLIKGPAPPACEFGGVYVLGGISPNCIKKPHQDNLFGLCAG